jgi:hypothetical protein
MTPRQTTRESQKSTNPFFNPNRARKPKPGSRPVIAGVAQNRKGKWSWCLTLANGTTRGATGLDTMADAMQALTDASRSAGVLHASAP